MNKKIRTAGICVLLAIWILLTAFLLFGEKADYTYSERRPLAQMPEITAKSIFSGKFMPDFEDFTLDQFPLRDSFRQVKSLFHYYMLNQSDNNGIYLVEDTVAKLEYPLNPSSVDYATGRLQHLYNTWLQDTNCKVYAAMVPDKGYYLAESNGYPAMDYEKLETMFREALPWADHVVLTDLLSAEDYYRTDTHWRQERILDVARRLCDTMGVTVPDNYTQEKVDAPFYGVYFGQAALPMAAEDLYVLQNDTLKACTVTDPITGTVSSVYNMDKLTSPDLYDVFLSGAQPLLTIDNPHGQEGKELVIFRDSFGSSLTPLLVQDYSRITLVDIRYIHPDAIGEFVTFAEQDVLFLYSTLILNSGRSLK
ncbi:MAG: hypothetical protein IIW56_03660 [Oscillospiraceae bacterium]|nr:hypothetical protein [Oscillospiraceae bacterium]